MPHNGVKELVGASPQFRRVLYSLQAATSAPLKMATYPPPRINS